MEFYYDILRSKGKDEADLIFEIIKDFSIIVIDNLSDDFLKKAGNFKPLFKTSFAGLFVLALLQPTMQPSSLPTITKWALYKNQDL